MPKIGVYLKDEDARFYEKEFKPMVDKAGDAVGRVFADDMRSYVARQELSKAKLKPITVFVGERDNCLGSIGEDVTFIGRLIAKDQREDGIHVKYGQALYQTRKQKIFLLHENIDQDGVVSRYDVYNNVKDLKDVLLLPKISEGLKNEKFGARSLDI